MAFQRPFLISLKRSDQQQPWGFRVFGGKDYEEPHVVQKVAPDGVAEISGLRDGDEIIQIGRVNIQDLTFGQVQELIARCGNRIEMFIIREDLLSQPRTGGKEPPCIKAVVHNPYNSPFGLYSTENVADALAKQTEVLTDGRISSAEEEEGPENLSFKQKSAVFHLLEEQAKQETVSQVYTSGSPQRKVAPPPPPKPKPPAQVNHYEEAYSPQSPPRHTSTAVITPTQPPQSTHPLQNQSAATVTFKVASKSYSSPQVKTQTTPQHSTGFKVGPPPPPRGSSHTGHTGVTTVHKQQQQQHHYQAQHQLNQHNQQGQAPFYPPHRMDYQQQVQQQREAYNSAPQYQEHQEFQNQQQQQQQHYQQQQYQQQQYQQHQQQPQQQYQQQPQQQYQQQQSQQFGQQYQQPQSFQNKERDQIFEQVLLTNTPITYKAPPTQKYQVSWPPTQNGSLRQRTPSPTPASPSKMPVSSVWPPRGPTVRELPKSGFNPAALREQGTGRRLVWPPAKTDEEMRSGRTTPQSPVTGRRVNWNPSPSPPTNRRCPFGSASPQNRRKDIQWPPPQPTGNKENLPRPSPRLSRKSDRFEDHIKQQASNNVPVTYRTPPGTQRIECD